MIGQQPPPVLLSQVIIGTVAFFLGVANSFITVPAQTVLQERAPETVRARVFAAFYTVSNVFLIPPLLIGASAADLFGVLPTVLGIAVVVLAIAGAGTRYLNRHRGVLETSTAPPLAGLGAEPEALLPAVNPTEMIPGPATPNGSGAEPVVPGAPRDTMPRP